MGASAILKSFDLRAFVVNVKTITLMQKLYQSGYVIWWVCVRLVSAKSKNTLFFDSLFELITIIALSV